MPIPYKGKFQPKLDLDAYKKCIKPLDTSLFILKNQNLLLFFFL